jgi:hypothetical protein
LRKAKHLKKYPETYNDLNTGDSLFSKELGKKDTREENCLVSR